MSYEHPDYPYVIRASINGGPAEDIEECPDVEEARARTVEISREFQLQYFRSHVWWEPKEDNDGSE